MEQNYSNYPALNAASDIWFCIEKISKRTKCEKLRFLIENCSRFNNDRCLTCIKGLENMKGVCTYKFVCLADYEMIRSYFELYLILSKIYREGNKMTFILWQRVQYFVSMEIDTFYTGRQLSDEELNDLICMYPD